MKVIHPDAEYLAFLKEGRFMLPRSRLTGRHVFHPRVVEPGTGCTDLDWVPAMPPEQVRIGLHVVARVDRAGAEPVLVFDPDPSA